MIIAQISDIHASPDNDNLSQLERALAWLDIIEPDALVVTGDLIDNDWFEGYETTTRTTAYQPQYALWHAGCGHRAIIHRAGDLAYPP